MSKSRNHDSAISMTIFSMKDKRSPKLQRKVSKFDLKNATLTLNGSSSVQALTQRCKPVNLYDSSFQKTMDTISKNSRKVVKPVLGVSHERSKSSIKTFGFSVVQTNESLKRSLINFRSDLLGLQHNERYSAETDSLVKLIQKYVDKLVKIEHRYKLK